MFISQPGIVVIFASFEIRQQMTPSLATTPCQSDPFRRIDLSVKADKVLPAQLVPHNAPLPTDLFSL